jgi:hypothetical protein
VFLKSGIFAIGCAAALCAQGPTITSVVSAASFNAGQVSASGFVSIFGTGLADQTYIAPVPYPNKLGSTEVFVCPQNIPSSRLTSGDLSLCQAARVQYASPAQLNVVLPDYVTVPLYGNPGFVVARINGSLDSAAKSGVAYRALIQTSAPGIFLAGRDCPIDSVPAVGGGPRWTGVNQNCGLFPQEPVPDPPRGPLILPSRANRGVITDLQGNLVWSGNRARIGQFYTIWLTGLGAITAGNPPLGFAVALLNIPAYGYPNPTIGGAVITYVGAVSQYPGLYQVNIQIPSSVGTGPLGYGAWPCGNYDWELSLYVGYGVASNVVDFPLAIRTGDVSCKP